MREIKFRAWLPGISKMTYSHTLEELMNWDTKKEDNGTAIWLQYTGLKDKNGKEIYEGDVVKSVALLNDHFQKGATNTLVVRNWMGNSCLCFEGQETGTPIYPLIVSHEIEVIGNIYENTELLEVSP